MLVWIEWHFYSKTHVMPVGLVVKIGWFFASVFLPNMSERLYLPKYVWDIHTYIWQSARVITENPFVNYKLVLQIEMGKTLAFKKNSFVSLVNPNDSAIIRMICMQFEILDNNTKKVLTIGSSIENMLFSV